ncbi:MAG: DUF3127 domain-containing protein [Bacteroidales bacterium]|jgi:hypothetical protein|nr:DUF3127 domain-containing protein [Bacteroidales bacterium]
MELTGKLIKKLEPVTGEGKNGPWKKQGFVIEVPSDFPKKVCFTVWGDKAGLSSVTESDTIKVYFDAESREYNNNWYTDLKCWKIELNAPGNAAPSTQQAPEFKPEDIPFDLEDDPGDDLPF